MSSPDRKRTPEESTAAAVVVTPHKKKQRLELEEGDDNRITAESIMGFPKYPNLTNREIMINHHDFVDWAKRKKKEGTAFGRLLDFVNNWVEESEEEVSKLSQSDDSGEEQFTFGKHRGQSFRWVASNDPSYHLRCKEKGYRPDKNCMNNYEKYFEHHGDRFAAEKGERDAILDRCYELGIGFHDCCYSGDDNYSDE